MLRVASPQEAGSFGGNLLFDRLRRDAHFEHSVHSKDVVSHISASLANYSK